MKVPITRSRDTGYHYPDALLALQLIAEATGTPHVEMAKTTRQALSHFDATFSHRSQHNKLTAYAREHLNVNTETNTTNDFKDWQLKALASLLGGKCQHSFATPLEMVEYAKANFVLKDGKKWITTEQEPSKSELKKQIAKLPQYKHAAKLLIPKTHKFLGELLSEDAICKQIGKYLEDERVSCTDERKVELMKHFAGILGRELELKEPLDADGMLALANQMFPKKILQLPDTSVKKGPRRA